MTARRAFVALLAGAALAPGCGTGWDAASLQARHPGLREAGPHRLADVTPYVWPARGELVLFLCRWSTEAPLPVALPADASAGERRALQAALRAWQGAGLGVRFLTLDGGTAPLEIHLEPGPVATAAGPGTGNTIADCRLDERAEGAAAALPAELVAASIRIGRRTPPDPRGRERVLTPEELAGAALHELGHALGFQGHVRSGESVLRSDVELQPRIGAAVLDGAPFADATLRALYAVPNGTVLRRTPVEAWRTDLVDRMARLARANALDGAFVRVGDRAGRVFWRAGDGHEYGLAILDVRGLLRRPGRVLVVPEPRTRNALPRSRDRLR